LVVNSYDLRAVTQIVAEFSASPFWTDKHRFAGCLVITDKDSDWLTVVLALAGPADTGGFVGGVGPLTL